MLGSRSGLSTRAAVGMAIRVGATIMGAIAFGVVGCLFAVEKKRKKKKRTMYHAQASYLVSGG